MAPRTKCYKCKFKKIDINNHQVGCYADIKEKIISQYPDIYSENSFSFVDGHWMIDDFLCPIGRPGEVTDNFDEINKAYQDNKIRLYLVYFMNEDLDQLEKNLITLKNSYIKPCYISIILKPQLSSLSKNIVELLQKYEISPWKVHTFIEEVNYCEYVDVVLSTNIKNNNTQYYSIWDNSEIPELYYNTASDVLTFLSAKNPIIEPIKTEPYHIGCVIPFSTYLHDDFKKCHGLVVYNLFDSPSHNRLVVSII